MQWLEWNLKLNSYPHCTGQADNTEHLTEVLPTGCLSKPYRSCSDLTGTDITVILHQWTHKETIPGATRPFIYILIKCMCCNGGRASGNVPFNSGCIKRSSGAALAGIWVDCQFISGRESKEEEPCGSRPKLLLLPLYPPDNYLSAVWDQVILGP